MPEQPLVTTDQDRESPEYIAGWQAYIDGLTHNDNPYRMGNNRRRYLWFSGHYDRRHLFFFPMEPPPGIVAKGGES